MLAILDETSTVADFEGLDVDHWRLVGKDPSRVRLLPAGVDYSLWNEDDIDSPLGQTERLAAAQTAKTLRPDCRLWYGAERPGVAPDPVVLAECAGLLVHSRIFDEPPAATTPDGKPIVVGELEFDPANGASQIPQAPAWCARCPAPAFVFTWVWRDGDSRLNLADYPNVAARLAALNKQEQPMPDNPLNIGAGLQAWIAKAAATPLMHDEYKNEPDGSLVYERALVLVGDADGKTKDPLEVFWLAATGAIYTRPFGTPA